jgi:iron complex outermembrane receptor protein
MGSSHTAKFAGAAMALTASISASHAQIALPPIDVNFTRLNSGMVGTSNSIITSQDIERSPAQNLPDILSQEVGIQIQHLLSSTNGSRDAVDLRGFGAFAQSNVLILVNGRRFQDNDLQGFDFSSIPLNSIERIEITRGNSGTTLYGDGAIGGVINIVLKKGSSPDARNRVEVFGGSFQYWEGRASAAVNSGPWSVGAFGNAISSDGYRVNSALRQRNINSTLSYNTPNLGAYFTVAGDRQFQGLPGGLNNINPPGGFPFTLETPWQSNNPLDWGKKQAINFATGFNATLSPGIELIVDGSVRRKFQQAQFFNYFENSPPFAYTVAGATSMNYVDTAMTTSSVTPRLDVSHRLFGLPNRLLTGIDFYNTQYDSDRPTAPGLVPVHKYEIQQRTLGFYAMNTTAVRPDTDISIGGRIQNNFIDAHDTYSAVNDPLAGLGNNPQIPPFDQSEWQWAAHLGVEHRFNNTFAVFGRAARAFRLPNADERVGAGGPLVFTVPTFDLKTQTSWDVEGGVRVNIGQFRLQSSVYLMQLKNEVHFLPAIGVNTNLDPTQRVGWETSAFYQINNSTRVRGGVTYINATFRDGAFAGNEIPLVSQWSGYAGLTWDIVPKWLTLDVTSRLFGSRRMDNDQANVQPVIPAQATADVKFSGQYDRFFWSAAVLNVFDKHYYDYAIASGGIAAGVFAPSGIPPTIGLFNAFPLAGRTFLLQAGATF